MSKRGKWIRRNRSTPPPNMPKMLHPSVWAFSEPNASERMLVNLNRLLEDQEFESDEELNAFLEPIMLGGGLPQAEPRTALEKAQEIAYDAWEAKGKKRMQLARQALEISEDCVDAYVILVFTPETTDEKSLVILNRAIEIGESLLGPEFMEENVGHFWGITMTRPYMRALEAKARTLWALARNTEAIAVAQEMLRLNPGDNQGARYKLSHWLLSEKRIRELKELFAAYADDPTPDMIYNKTLVLFQESGDSGPARHQLRDAKRWNAHVAPILLGYSDLPSSPPHLVEPGSVEEAEAYTLAAISMWKNTPGAMDWLAKRARV
ncbi:MAG: hypothetical protein J5I90_12635 [Caldilineales bacterium]|nr:hypothetical protein [Caldilineales bacterium]